MKFWKAIIAALTVLILCVGQVDAKPGNGGGKPGGGGEDPPAATSCASKSSTFPAFAYTRLNAGKRSVSSIDFYLSNADGDCSILIHTANVNENEVDLSYRQIGNYGVIAWSQGRDETQDRKSAAKDNFVIRVLRFQVKDKEVFSVQPVETVANSGDPYIYFESMDLSTDGNSIVFIHSDSVVYGTYIQTIREIDILNCSSNCSQSVIYAQSSIEGLLSSISYGASSDRVYYSGTFKSSSGDPRGSQGFISFIEDQRGSWSAPRELTYEGNGSYGNDFSGSITFWKLDAALVDFGNGDLTEAVSYRFNNIATGQDDVHVIDVGTCSASGSGDCLNSSESSLEISLANASLPSLGRDSLLFSSGSSDNIFEYVFSSEALSIVALGNEADSAH